MLLKKKLKQWTLRALCLQNFFLFANLPLVIKKFGRVANLRLVFQKIQSLKNFKNLRFELKKNDTFENLNFTLEENEKSAMGSGDFDKGLVFKVQVGAMKKINNDFKEGDKKYVVEEDADGTLKYTLGYFRVYEDADNFKRVLRGMGLKEAKVEAYQDNKRIELKEALYQLREDSTPPASGYEPVEEDW